VIEAAAERQSEYVRKCRIGEYGKLADRLLYEIEEAKHCLLNPRLRKEYDERFVRPQKRLTKSPPPPSTIVKPVGEGTEIVRTFFGVMSVIIGGFFVMLLFSFALPWKKLVFSDSLGPPNKSPVSLRPRRPIRRIFPRQMSSILRADKIRRPNPPISMVLRRPRTSRR
jgi:hypothetical protein